MAVTPELSFARARKGEMAMTNKTLIMPAAGVEAEVMPVRGRVVKSKWARDLLTFLMVFGPGLIVMVADNDAGAVSTYSQAGAQYGTHLLWIVLLLLPVTYFIQEMVVRLGIATGKGHAAMIYQRFGKWWGLFSLVDLELVNFLTLVTEFAAIDLALSKLGVDPRFGVPLVGGGPGPDRADAEATAAGSAPWFSSACWIWPGSRSPSGCGRRWRRSCADRWCPAMPAGGLTPDLMFLVIAIVGTTIAPWQLFFQQSCIADKRLRFADVKWARLDTFLGACITITAAGCMMIAGNASRVHGFTLHRSGADGRGYRHLRRRFCKNAILLMMINAAVLGTTAISLSSAWAYGEVRGWPHSLQLPVREARGLLCRLPGCAWLRRPASC